MSAAWVQLDNRTTNHLHIAVGDPPAQSETVPTSGALTSRRRLSKAKTAHELLSLVVAMGARDLRLGVVLKALIKARFRGPDTPAQAMPATGHKGRTDACQRAARPSHTQIQVTRRRHQMRP